MMNIRACWVVVGALLAPALAQVIPDSEAGQADRRSASASAQNGNGKR